MRKPHTIIYGLDAEFAAWAAARLPHVGADLGFGNCRAVGVATGTQPTDKLLAVVVYHEWQPKAATIQISCYSTTPMWAQKCVLEELLEIPFERMGVNKVWLSIPHTNERAIRFNVNALKMKREGPLRHQYGPGLHAVIVGMTRNEWIAKWKGVSDVKAQRAHAA